MPWPSCVNEERLQVPFEPAGTLANPVPDAAVRLFVRRGGEDTHSEPPVVGAHAQIGILGDVEGVPSAKYPECFGPEVV